MPERLNSVNHDKIQEQYGYQRYSISENRYIFWYSSKDEISTTICGICSEWWLAIDSNKNMLCILALVMCLLPDGYSGNDTTFGFCHDSLNSVKFL